jgi:ligand-binding sensor domain-containing protein
MGRPLVFAVLAALVGHVASAEVLKTVQQLAPPLSFDHLGNVDGLPNSDVRVIAQDRRGFLWFGTQDGLARYDGTKMRVYRPNENDPTSISGGYITAITLDASGKLWVGTDENGVDLYDPDTDQFTRYVHSNAKGSPSTVGVTAIVRDTKDRIWFAMSNGNGLDRFDPATNTFAEYVTGPLETAITALAVDKSGNLWLGTASEGVLRWNPDDNSSVSYRPQPGDERGLGAAPITSILVASTGSVWIGTDGEGLVQIDPAAKRLVHHRESANDPGTISDDHVSALFEDRHHDLWIGTTNGLNRMDSANRMVQYHHDPNDPTSLAFPQVETIFQDAGGVTWVGGFTSGVCKFDELRMKFGHYRTRTHSANSYFEDPDGTLWVGTENGGLYKYELKAQRVTLYHSFGPPGDEGSIALESAWISSLHRDHRGTLWIALKGQGLIAFDTTHETYKQYGPDPDKPNGLPVDTIWDIWEDDHGMLWLATWGGGLVRFDPQLETFTAIPPDASSLPPYLYVLYPDPNDKKILWIGTAHGGLVRFDTVARTGSAFRHKADNAASLASDDVLSVYRDPQGTVWVGTYGGGLNQLDPSTGKAKHFTTSNSGLTNDVLWGILPDDDGKLWLATNGGGLARFDPKAGTFLVYDATDGVQDSEFGQGSFMRSKSGKLYVGGVGGFNAFFPKDITRDAYVPPVAMTGFKIFNEDVKLERPIWTLPAIEVSYSESFEIQFAALSFAAPSKNHYAYKLEGFDDKFIETDRPFTTYTKLPGGKYTLRIRASNEHGVWNEAGIALKISVKPPIWRTWPAFAIYVVVLAAAVFLLFRMQQQKVRRVEREGRLAVVERDLELSGAVQSGFLPAYNEIHSARLQLYGFYRAADACSGDWWWHETLGGRHVVLVGDVTGHGPGPAMVTAAVATAFRILTATGVGLVDVKQALDLLNRVVLDVAKGKYHMTMAALELDETTGRWVLYSAGAPPILMLDHTGKHKVLFAPGAPLGTESTFETGRLEGQLESGDRILIYTDGIPEISLPNGNVLGMRRFAQMYERTRNQNLKDAAAAMVQMADQTQGPTRQADDWTFTLIEWNA